MFAEYFVWDIDPVLLKLGALQIRWYGICFASAIIAGYGVEYLIFKHEGKDVDHLDPLLYRLIGGIVIGARLGHCLFYEPTIYLKEPWRILKVWEGGLASHGAVIGIFLALYLFLRKFREHGYNYLSLLDMMTIPAMIGSAFIRLGNFFNSEIIGTSSSVPWAVVFKRVSPVPRHPVQLYESLTYLIVFVLLTLLYLKTNIIRKKGAMTGLLLILVFSTRFLWEFLKRRQSEFGETLTISMGQWLSVPLVLLGLFLIVKAYSRKVENG